MDSDQRFSAIRKDPRFRLMSKRERKVKIDDRFTKMFTDKNFKLKYTVDKRGRPVSLTSNDHLQSYYELSSSDVDSSDGESERQPSAGKVSKVKAVTCGKAAVSGASEESGVSASAKGLNAGERQKLAINDTAGKSTTSASADRLKGRSQIGSSGSKLPTSKKDRARQCSGEKARGHIEEHRSKGNLTTAVRRSTSSSSEEEDEQEQQEVEDTSGTDDDVASGTERAVEQHERDASEVASEDDDNEMVSGDLSDGSSGQRLRKRAASHKANGNRSSSASPDRDRKRAKLLAADGPDYARGEGMLSSSDSDSDDSFYDDAALAEDVAHDDHYWGEMDKEAEQVEEATSRLAVCNMDWDRIKACDLMVLLNSFKPADGVVKSVKIYPSDYGIERLKEEEQTGPKELRDAGAQLSKEDANLSEKEREKKHREWLRLYQLNRLKYYYAVVECDTAATAGAIYENCDGLEYESSSTRLDLRFIPDDMTFDDRQPTSEVTNLSGLATYKPSLFVNTALNQSKVDCTWDETSKDRLVVTNRKFKKDELETMDLNVYSYLASSSSSESGDDDAAAAGADGQSRSSRSVKGRKSAKESRLAVAETGVLSASDDGSDGESDDEEATLKKYRSLVQEIEKNVQEGGRGKDDVEMEITWEPGLKEDAEALVDQKAAEASGMTVWDKYLEKRRDKKKQKFEQKKLAKDEDITKSDVGKKHRKRDKMKGADNAQADAAEEKTAAELSLLVADDDGKKHFNMKKIVSQEKLSKKKKKQSKKPATDDFQIDLNDTRFSAVYTSHLYNIDPSAQEFKKTKASMALIEEKLKRRAKSDTENAAAAAGTLPKQQSATSHAGAAAAGCGDAGLAMLIKSVKAKTQNCIKQQAKKS